MKTYLCLLSGACTLLATGCAGTSPAYAEPAVPVALAPAGPPPPAPADSGQQLATAPAPAAPPQADVPAVGSLDELVGPIALYPDALVALILPASTASADVVLAARYLDAGGDPKEVESRSWDDSVKALAHYPDVVKWMDENLAWTQRLGEAYLNQPQEVMAAIQRDRARAQANGALQNTPQQEVVAEDGAIRIIPAQPDVIYVPRYDPEIVYVDQPVYVSSEPWLTFGIGFGVGSWLAYDCDWHSRSIWIDPHRREHWGEHRDWRHPVFPDRGGFAHEPGWRQWTPPPGRRPPRHREGDWAGRNVIRPTPMPGTPRFDGDRRRPPGSQAGPDRPAQFRPGARFPRPVNPPASTVMRPDRTHPTRPATPAGAGQNRWANDGRRDGAPAGQRFVPGARFPTPVGGAPAAVTPNRAPPPSREVRRERSEPHNSDRSFAPATANARPIAPAPRVAPAPIAPQVRMMPRPAPAAIAPRPSAPPPRVVAPAASQPARVTPGARVPRVEQKDERGRSRD